MKALVLALSLTLGAGTLSAQAAATKPMDMSSHAMSGWKELDAFHMLMMETWHPVSKSGDLKPIRAKASAMADAAKTWAASTVPAACDTKPVRDAVAAVARDSRSLADLVAKQGSDADVKKALGGLHHTFETAEGCESPKKSEHKMDGHKHP